MGSERAAWGRRAAAVACSVALVTVSAVAAGVPALVPGIVGGAALLVLPGEALLAALFPRTARRVAGPRAVERAVWMVALGLACAALGGLVLNLLPGGIGRVSWAVWLAGVDVAAASVALARHDTGPVLPRVRLPRRQTAMITAAAVLASAAVATAAVGAARVPGPSFAELWMVRGDHATARLGVRSDAHRKQAYWLALSHGDGRLTWWYVTLAPGETWRTAVMAPPRRTLRATLYLGTGDRPYRQVSLRPPAR